MIFDMRVDPVTFREVINGKRRFITLKPDSPFTIREGDYLGLNPFLADSGYLEECALVRVVSLSDTHPSSGLALAGIEMVLYFFPDSWTVGDSK